MPNQDSGDKPSSDSKDQSLPQSPMTQPAPQQNEMGNDSQHAPKDNQDRTMNLIRTGECWLIGINGFAVILNIVIALIYWGQLCQMRRATDAAKQSADLFDKQLKATYSTALKVFSDGVAVYCFEGVGNKEHCKGPTDTMVDVQFRSWLDKPVTEVRFLVAVAYRTEKPKLPYDIPENQIFKIEDYSCQKPSSGPCATEIHKFGLSGYDEYIAGKQKLYVWGSGTYKDALKDSGSFVFCRYISADKASKSTLPYKAGFENCLPPELQ